MPPATAAFLLGSTAVAPVAGGPTSPSGSFRLLQLRQSPVGSLTEAELDAPGLGGEPYAIPVALFLPIMPAPGPRRGHPIDAADDRGCVATTGAGPARRIGARAVVSAGPARPAVADLVVRPRPRVDPLDPSSGRPPPYLPDVAGSAAAAGVAPAGRPESAGTAADAGRGRGGPAEPAAVAAWVAPLAIVAAGCLAYRRHKAAQGRPG